MNLQIFGLKTFEPQNFLNPKNLFGPKRIWLSKKIYSDTKISCTKTFWILRKFCTQKSFGPKYFWTPEANKNHCYHKIFWTKINLFISTKFIFPSNIFHLHNAYNPVWGHFTTMPTLWGGEQKYFYSKNAWFARKRKKIKRIPNIKKSN